MNARSSRFHRLGYGLGLVAWTMALIARAQTPPTLTLELRAETPTLALVGRPGAVYSIQDASGLSPAHPWRERTLFRAHDGKTTWSDPAPPDSAARFYRAVQVVEPADKNLVFVSPGTFTMGSPVDEALRFPDEVPHQVTISRGFWIGRYLVTQAEFLDVTGKSPSYFSPANGYADDPVRPVEQVTWEDATNYCGVLTTRERAAGRIPLQCAFRLSTESEWEYAARAGTTTAFYLGSRLSSGQANFLGRYEYDAAAGQINNPNGAYLEQTTPVGSFGPNPWGLYDMIGNVWEWCRDWYAEYPAGPVTDPQGPASGPKRVARGGDWSALGRFCRSAQRSGNVPAPTSRRLGFRVVLALADP